MIPLLCRAMKFLAGRQMSRRRWPRARLEGPEPLEARLVLSPLGVPPDPSVVSVHQGDYRVFVQGRLPDDTLSSPAPLLLKGVNWSPGSIGTTQANVTQEFAKSYQTDI